MKTDKKELAIISVNYENYQVSEELLKSLGKQEKQNFHVYLADISTARKDIEQHDFLEVLSGENKGYAYGVNLGLKKALEDGYTRFIVMNNDVELDSLFSQNALESIDKHPLSIIGGKIYYFSGYEYHKDRYKKDESGKVIWYAGGSVDWDHATISHRGVDEVDTDQYNSFEETGFITGCLMCFDKKTLEKIGMWDESYFLYFEDADWCEKAKRVDVKLYYDPSIIIWHKNAQSTGGSGSSIHVKYQKDSQMKFGMKYAPLRTKLHLLKNFMIR